GHATRSASASQAASSVVLPKPGGAATTVSALSAPSRSSSTSSARATYSARIGGGVSFVSSTTAPDASERSAATRSLVFAATAADCNSEWARNTIALGELSPGRGGL